MAQKRNIQKTSGGGVAATGITSNAYVLKPIRAHAFCLNEAKRWIPADGLDFSLLGPECTQTHCEQLMP